MSVLFFFSNTVDPDRPAPEIAVCSESTLFGIVFMIKNKTLVLATMESPKNARWKSPSYFVGTVMVINKSTNVVLEQTDLRVCSGCVLFANRTNSSNNLKGKQFRSYKTALSHFKKFHESSLIAALLFSRLQKLSGLSVSLIKIT